MSDTSNPIKTDELCERCEYVSYRCIENDKNCYRCDIGLTPDERCKCTDIRENTPCPYFEEAE